MPGELQIGVEGEDMLEIESTALVIIDIQGKLAHLMAGKDALFGNVQKIIKGARILKLPIIWLEQYPEGLGPTVPEVADLLSDMQPISKMTFSACRNDDFLESLNTLERKQLLIAGIETHVCVYQTVIGLVDLGYEAQVLADAVSSRELINKEIGLQRMKDHGAVVSSVEMVLFELLERAGGDRFKEIIEIIK